MKLAFYVAFQPKPKDETYVKYVKRLWLDWVIAIVSLGRHSHVELVDGDDWFSISPRTGEAGVRQIKPKAGRWEFLELPLDQFDEWIVKSLFNEYKGKRYDYIGAVFSITKLCIQKPDKVFCSEVCVDILNKTYKYRYLGDGCKYSPAKLYKKVKSWQ
jgi:hypothetical protein